MVNCARWRSLWLADLRLALLVALVFPAGAGASCVGDCPPPDGQVAVNELVLGVNIALGSAALNACPGYDTNGNGSVGVDELITAVNNAQQGCTGVTTPTATQSTPPPPSSTPTPLPRTPTPTVTATPALGPTITFFGVVSADDTLQMPTARDPNEIPIYQRPFGFGFSLVVEAGRGLGQRNVGDASYAIGEAPDLQIQATRELGNGSAEVCDDHEPNFGGVPGIDPPNLQDPSAIANALNDFGCRFIDGMGRKQGRSCATACIRSDGGDFICKDPDNTEVQFCAPVSMPLQFPDGDTLVTVRVRDVFGNLGPPAQLIIRVAP